MHENDKGAGPESEPGPEVIKIFPAQLEQEIFPDHKC